MEDPDYGWKPSRRPQSTIAINFMTELDSLFKLDGDLDTLDKTVHQKKQAVTSQTQELEALEARLRETENRLNQAKSGSPPRRTDGSSAQDVTRLQGLTSSSSQRNAQSTRAMPGALPETPPPQAAADYVLVERPRSAQPAETSQA